MGMAAGTRIVQCQQEAGVKGVNVEGIEEFACCMAWPSSGSSKGECLGAQLFLLRLLTVACRLDRINALPCPHHLPSHPNSLSSPPAQISIQFCFMWNLIGVCWSFNKRMDFTKRWNEQFWHSGHRCCQVPESRMGGKREEQQGCGALWEAAGSPSKLEVPGASPYGTHFTFRAYSKPL